MSTKAIKKTTNWYKQFRFQSIQNKLFLDFKEFVKSFDRTQRILVKYIESKQNHVCSQRKTPQGAFNLQCPQWCQRMELQSTENSYPLLPGRQLSPIPLAEQYNQSP